MKYGSIVIAILIIGLAISLVGCTKTTEPVATTTVTTSVNGQTTTTTQGSGTATTASQATTATTVTTVTATTTAATTTVTTTETCGGPPGIRAAIPPATLGSCTPGDPYMGYHTIPLSGVNYANNNGLANYTVTIVSRDYSKAPFTPSITLRVVDTVYNLSVLKQQMGNKGGYWGQTIDDVNHYAAFFSSQGYNGWEYLNKNTLEAWAGVEICNGIYMYAYSDGAYGNANNLADIEAFINGLDLNCWAGLAPAY